MEEKKSKKRKLKFVLFVILASVAVAAYLFSGNNGDDDNADRFAAAEFSVSEGISSSGASGSVKEQPMIYVDIGGAVTVPGVVCIPEGSRVFEALEQAGGTSGDADTKSLNLASLCVDGEKIYVPTTAETAADPSINASVSNTSGSTEAGKAEAKVNINTADSEGLQTLSGVGPSTAQKIIDYREKNGRFASVDELTEVSGIGEKTLEKLREYICV